MDDSPLSVSAIIPAYNARDYLAEAIGSVLWQRHRPVEIIVVDDGSTDGTSEVAASFPEVRLVRQPNGGPAATRNRGLSLAEGRIIAFLDADDLWTDDKLAVQLPHFEANPRTDIVLGRRQYLRLAGGEGAGRNVASDH